MGDSPCTAAIQSVNSGFGKGYNLAGCEYDDCHMLDHEGGNEIRRAFPFGPP